MNLSTIEPFLRDHRKPMLSGVVETLESSVAAGLVRNQDFTRAKQVINWSVDESEDAFLKSGPARTAERNDWWSRAYDADALVSGSHTLPAVLKRARKAGNLPEYVDFIERALLPLHDLLEAAKPLVVKRGDARMPPPKTPEQIAREAAQMTCQCCGKLYLANLGTVAHHGYERPGEGYQTESCMGAKYLPFEVARARLAVLIGSLKEREGRRLASRQGVQDEVLPITLTFPDHDAPRRAFGKRPTRSVDVTRDTFEAARQQHLIAFLSNTWGDFASVKANVLASRDREIAGVRAEITAQQARYDGWNQTHRWNDDAKEWEAI